MKKIKAAEIRDRFERMLDKAVSDIETTIGIAPSMSNMDFEKAVLRSIKKAAKGTPFENTVKPTDPGSFPDVVAGYGYGVEVKQIQKGNPRTRGNSIFESARVKGVKIVYLIVLWGAADEGRVKWRRYEETIADVKVTHSPRYLIDISLQDGESLFDKIGIPYDKFRVLEWPEKMEHVRNLYRGMTEDLWWFESLKDRNPLRSLEGMPDDERYKLIGEAFFLCPVIFGTDGKTKYMAPFSYWLSQGAVSRATRDKFTSSGRRKILNGVSVPQVIYRAAVSRNHDIRKAAENVDDDMIKQFWKVEKLPKRKDRLSAWLMQVRKEYKGPVEGLLALEKAFKSD